ncbi:MAG TPA: SpoIIE family protein phosphatase, partial [Solirubrobacteraceae bacterium]|nr:SpoIIE family protein phosphatase [Solirubrobacteraceae bacterium]
VETVVEREARETVVDGIVERVAREREPITIADVPAEGIDASSLGGAITSLLAVPLLDGGRVIGSLQVGTLTRRAFDREAVGLLRLAADRAGLAIARTRLYERERRIAQELQRSLLPKRLPDVAGVALGARYEPGENGTAVGGDWYDAIALPSGRIALAIGDVVGRGIEAAATMGQMRSALRAILMQADDTGKMADRLNRFTLGLGSDEAIMTTVVLAILEPGTGTLRFTNAGHPPPLLVGADGSAAYLAEPPAPPMGVLATPRYKEHTTRLEPGATLVLYTDGLVEEPTEVLDVGLERLREAAGAMGTDVEAACESLLDSLRDETARSDDVTLLVVRLQETLGEKVSLEVSNESGGLFTMRQTLRRWLVEQGADADETEDVIMACNEACENSVEHGYDCGDDLFAVDFEHDEGEICVSVRDHGTWREPRETPDRGRGLPLMRKLMDVVEVQPRPAGTTVRMSRRLAVAPPTAAGQPRAGSAGSG